MKFLKNLNSGTYGHTVLVKNEDKKCLLKVSNVVDFKTRHEFMIMSELEKIKDWCPHFCLPVALKTALVNTNFLRSGKGSLWDPGYTSVPMDMCLMEYIPNGLNFEHIIKDRTHYPMAVIYSIIKQVLFALACAQDAIKFTHYDLHTDNILLQKCDANAVHVYNYNGKIIKVPTYGLIAKIIDFGFSYVDSCTDAPIRSAIMFPHLGYTSNTFDAIADSKIFLISIMYELNKYRPKETPMVFKNIVRNLFNSSHVDLSNGWNTFVQDIAYDELVTFVKRQTKSSKCILTQHTNECLDIMQYGITLPLKKKSTKDFKLCLRAFIAEWIKFEQLLPNSESRLHFFKFIVESSVFVKEYENIEDSVREFKTTILNQPFYKFFYPASVKYRNLLGALYLMYDCIENTLYTDFNNCHESVVFQYADDPINICGIIHHHFNSDNDPLVLSTNKDNFYFYTYTS